MQIEDGFGTGYRAKIDDDGRMLTSTIALDVLQIASNQGEAFSATIDSLALTSGAGETGVIYILNTGDVPIHISDFLFSTTATSRVRLYKNATTGTLITGGNAYIPVNLNFGSGKSMSATVLTGDNGDTVTNGTKIVSSNHLAGVYARDTKGAYTLNRGDSLVISITPAADTTIDLTVFMYQTERAQ